MKTTSIVPLKQDFKEWLTLVNERLTELSKPEHLEHIAQGLTILSSDKASQPDKHLVSQGIDIWPLLYLHYVEGFPTIPEPDWAENLYVTIWDKTSVSIVFYKDFYDGDVRVATISQCVDLILSDDPDAAVLPAELLFDDQVIVHTVAESEQLLAVFQEAIQQFEQALNPKLLKRPIEYCAEPALDGFGVLAGGL